jgi:hypothetical protein
MLSNALLSSRLPALGHAEEAWLIDSLTSQKATRGQGETFH